MIFVVLVEQVSKMVVVEVASLQGGDGGIPRTCQLINLQLQIEKPMQKKSRASKDYQYYQWFLRRRRCSLCRYRMIFLLNAQLKISASFQVLTTMKDLNRL